MQLSHSVLLVFAVAPCLAAQQRFEGQVLGPPWSAQGTPLVGDLDGDGDADLLSWFSPTGNLNSTFLGLQRGDGSGWVQAPELGPAIPVLSGPAAIFDADLDGDLDTVVPNGALLRILIESNDGAGQFSAGSIYDVYSSLPTVRAADVNLDGQDDIVVCNAAITAPGGPPFPYVAQIFLGNGPGGHVAGPVFEIDKDVKQFVVADMDDDGLPDLVLPNSDGGSVTFLLGDGAGNFPTLDFGFADAASDTVAVGDVNGDGHPEVVSSRKTSAFVSVAFYEPGAIDQPWPKVISVGAGPIDLDVADMDHDGRADIVATFAGTVPGIKVLRSTAGGTVFPVIEQQFIGPNPGTTTLADVDGDGELDVLASSYAGALLFRGAGDGTFVHTPAVPAHPSSRALLIADVTGDGAADLVAANPLPGGGPSSPSFLTLYAGDGAGGFAAGLELPTGGLPCDIAAGDLDGDGLAELIVPAQGTHELRILRASGGSWTSVMPDAWPWFQWSQDPRAVDVADLDGDGRLDLLVPKGAPHQLDLLLATGPLSFGAPLHIDVGVGHSPLEALAADFDDDGDPDVVLGSVGSGAPSDVRLLLNDGGGALSAAAIVNTPVFEHALAIGDFNLDGHLDTVTGKLDVLLGNGAGGLVSTGAPQLTNGINMLSTADLDGDGLQDVVAPHWSGTVVVARGDGAGGFSSDVGVFAASTVTTCAVGDVNGDSVPDLVASGAEPRFTVHVNHTAPFAWKSLGGALRGGFGTPTLQGVGPLTSGSPMKLVMDQGAPAAASVLVVGLSSLGAPFKGGVMVPQPNLVLAGLVLDAKGYLSLPASWPAGLPSGLQLWLQDWIPDAAGPHGWSATNGMLATAP